MFATQRNLGIVLAIAFAAVVVIILTTEQQQRDAASADRRAEAAAARAELADAVAEANRGMTIPAHDARNAASALREAAAEAISGSGDADAIEERIELRTERLRTAADDLDATSDTTVAAPPRALPIASVERVLERLDATRAQASEVAEIARDAAARTQELALAALALNVHTSEFVDAADDLPDSDDPDAVAAAWRDELDRLESHRRAAEAAADHAPLAELAAAHLAIIDELEADAQASISALDDGDVGTYNEHREARLDAVGELTDDLLDATQTSMESAVAEIEHAEARVLALLVELESLRNETPAELTGA